MTEDAIISLVAMSLTYGKPAMDHTQKFKLFFHL